MAKRTSSRRTRSYYKNPRPSPKSSDMSDGAKISFALAGVAVVGGIGYYLWNQSQTAAANTTAGGGTISSGNQPYQLGTSTSTGMPAASTTSDGLPISYEAGAGTNAPLVATG